MKAKLVIFAVVMTILIISLMVYIYQAKEPGNGPFVLLSGMIATLSNLYFINITNEHSKESTQSGNKLTRDLTDSNQKHMKELTDSNQKHALKIEKQKNKYALDMAKLKGVQSVRLEVSSDIVLLANAIIRYIKDVNAKFKEITGENFERLDMSYHFNAYKKINAKISELSKVVESKSSLVLTPAMHQCAQDVSDSFNDIVISIDKAWKSVEAVDSSNPNSLNDKASAFERANKSLIGKISYSESCLHEFIKAFQSSMNHASPTKDKDNESSDGSTPYSNTLNEANYSPVKQITIGIDFIERCVNPTSGLRSEPD